MSKFTDWDTSEAVKITNRPPQCPDCAHLRDDKLWTCDAYPQGIPGAILSGDWDHTQPFPRDRGIRFERKNFR
jgi:hypothetical protein